MVSEGAAFRRVTRAFALLGVLACAAPCMASEHPSPDVDVVLYAGTRVPIHLGVGASVELPNRLGAQLELGVLPGAYVNGINTVVQAFDGYNDATAELIEIATRNALVVHLGARFRFVERLGLYASAGYTLATLGGAATGEELLEDVLGLEAPASADGSRSFDLGSTLHNLEFAFGWRFLLPKQWTLRTELGLLWCASARANVSSDGPTGGSPAARPNPGAFERAAEAYLVETYETYVISPTLALWFGRRF